ncbi:MAG: aminotransferase class I/II-fold pyridoxal phosphate-dependent enzyme [Oscillospiraceae bacterium]|jgi:histidinol-phosphate aminotransferase|nr:aminotransferase class I/II-fold pyridoxal phosphate-dependent enzyme [Oscillospiraceae bacterium]
MYDLPEKLKNFTPYEPLTGEYKIRLDVNESFIEIDGEKIAEAVKSVKFNRYPDPCAKGVTDAFARLFGIESVHVTAGNGSDELISVITACLLEKGTRLLCFAPDFSMYGFYARLYELDVITREKRGDFTIDTDAAIEFINAENIGCVVFSNPCNPTSLGLEKSAVTRLVTETKALIVADEAYMDFWDEKESLLADAANYDNLIVLRTCSKSVALAGIRLGFAVTNSRLSSALKTAKSPFNVNALTQAVGEAVLSDAENYRANVGKIKQSLEWLHKELLSLDLFEKIYPPDANFVFIKAENARGIYARLLEKGIAVRNFGGYLRICAGTDAENRALVTALREIRREGVVT